MRKRLVCIRDDWFAVMGYPFPDFPIKDHIYHAIDESICPCGCGAIGYELEEFPGVSTARPSGWYWRADWFREVDEVPPLSETTVDELLESIKVMEPDHALVCEWSDEEFHRHYYGVK